MRLFDESAKNNGKLTEKNINGNFFVDQEYLQMKRDMAKKYRILDMDEVFDVESCYKLRYWLETYVREDLKKAKGDKEQFRKIIKENPITIRINSYGGAVHELMATDNVIEQMRNMGYIVKTRCTGKAMSCGADLLIQGTIGERSAGKNSIILIHQMSGGTYGTTSNMRGDFEGLSIIGEMLDRHYYERTKITPEIMKEKTLGGNWYLTAEEALKYGVIDKII